MAVLVDMRPQQVRDLRQAKLAIVRDYFADVLAPQIGTGNCRVAAVQGGSESLVYQVQVDGRPVQLLRAERSWRRIRRRKAGHALLRERGIAAPDVIQADCSWRTYARRGYFFLLEEWIHGVPFCEYPDRQRANQIAGHFFGQLHRFTAGCHGVAAGMPVRWPSVGAVCRARTALLIRRYRKMPLPDADVLQQWFAAQPDSAWRQRPRLCQGDVVASNLLLGDEQASAIDLSEVRFASASMELARIHERLLGASSVAWRSFIDAYWAVSPMDLRDEIRRCGHLGRVAYYLHRVVTNRGHVRTARRVQALLDALSTDDFQDI